MKVFHILRLIFLCGFILHLANHSYAQPRSGTVRDRETSDPIAGVGVGLNGSTSVVVSDDQGRFFIDMVEGDSLTFTHLSYEKVSIIITSRDMLTVYMDRTSQHLEGVEIVNTGYQAIPRERATGSFDHIGNDQLNKSVSENILSRLEGIVSSLSYETEFISNEPSDKVDIRLRGVSTITGDTQPLIVLDNFPYEGDIENINPNDIESVTILKDAAASSIWGARAGNGVIVITTKTGRYSENVNVEFNSNLAFHKKPDLFYDRYFIPASEYIELEKELYGMGLYTLTDDKVFTPVVELMSAFDEGLLSENELNSRLESLKAYDIRDEAEHELYRNEMHQQYSIGLRGGGQRHKYNISTGYDKNFGRLVNDSHNRITIRTSTEVKLLDRLRLGSSIGFVQRNSKNNGMSLTDIRPSNASKIYVYARLKDENGQHLPIAKNNRFAYTDRAQEMGLLDWHYRPLDELGLNDNVNKSQEIILNGSLTYDILDGLSVEGRYNYQNMRSENASTYSEFSYTARHRYNRFTQEDGISVIPAGGYLQGSHTGFTSHYGRVQANYHNRWDDGHSFFSLAGAEIRQEITKNGPSYAFYGFDSEVGTANSIIDYTASYPTRPRGSARIDNQNAPERLYTNRFVSYFLNMGYDFMEKYKLSASARWDASNLFGVSFNQKGVPLWSAGAAWELSKEGFYNINWLSRVNLRATYGISGNVNRGTSALPYITYASSNSTGLQTGILRSPGNPDLRWEKVQILNLGLDFELSGGRLAGSIEYHKKRSTDLVGEDILDPTTGIMWTGSFYNIDSRRNYANLKSNGIDFTLRALVADKKLKWHTSILGNYIQNEVTEYLTKQVPTINSYLAAFKTPVMEGRSIDALYSLPWHGLDDQGNPQVLVDGELGTDYNAFFNNLAYEDLTYLGVSRPTFFGSVQNEFSYKGINLGFNILWKAGYYFRRGSVSYSSIFSDGVVHLDYLNRWKEPGDELNTNIPSMPAGANLRRDLSYSASDLLWERADHVRLHDISLSYKWKVGGRSRLKDLTVFGYAKNLGIIWRHNRHKLDPATYSVYPVPTQMSIGIKATL